jgi:folate-binding protein YgfZ
VTNTEPRSRSVLAWSAALLLATLLWLLVFKTPLGRDNWFITPHAPWPLRFWLFPLGTLAILGGLAALCAHDRFRRAKTRREQKTSTRLCLGALVLFSVVWPWSLQGPLGGFNVVAATWSDVANQYFSTALEVRDARAFSREYSKYQSGAEITKSHVATHPPGAVLLYVAALRVYDGIPFIRQTSESLAPGITAASTQSVAEEINNQLRRAKALNPRVVLSPSQVPAALWCAFLLSLCVGLTTPAVYLLAASGESDLQLRERRGLLAAAWWCLAPTVGLFAFTLDAVIACLVAWTLVFFARRLSGDSAWWMVAAGALLAVASFVSFGALAVWGLLFFALALAFGARSLITTPHFVLTDVLSRRRPTVHRPFSDVAWLLLGFGGVWLLLNIALPMQPLQIYDRAMQAHHAATLTSRSYWGWGWLNWVMFALFCGWPVVVALGIGLLRWFSARRASLPFTWNTPRLLGVAALLLCVLLSLSGNVRGETERLWLFLAPSLCAWAAIEYSIATARVIVALLVLQLVQTLLMAERWRRSFDLTETMNTETYRAASRAVWRDMTHWGRIAVGGADGGALLHHLTTNNIKGLRAGQGCDTALINSKGRLLDLTSVFRRDEDYLVLTSPNRRDMFVPHAQKFVLYRQDVKLHDVTSDSAMFGIFGSQLEDALTALDIASLPQESGNFARFNQDDVAFYAARTRRLPGEGVLLWSDNLPGLRRLVEQSNVPLCDNETYNVLRVEAGIPVAGMELTEAINPWEAGLDSAISLHKGCYNGQEIVARLNTYKKVKQGLQGLRYHSRSVPNLRC